MRADGVRRPIPVARRDDGHGGNQGRIDFFQVDGDAPSSDRRRRRGLGNRAARRRRAESKPPAGKSLDVAWSNTVVLAGSIDVANAKTSVQITRPPRRDAEHEVELQQQRRRRGAEQAGRQRKEEVLALERLARRPCQPDQRHRRRARTRGCRANSADRRPSPASPAGPCRGSPSNRLPGDCARPRSGTAHRSCRCGRPRRRCTRRRRKERPRAATTIDRLKIARLANGAHSETQNTNTPRRRPPRPHERARTVDEVAPCGGRRRAAPPGTGHWP